ncbi:MAG: monovalent cation/H+ antiporter subunit D family protein [Granulosicoccus sp.]|nr:monovalent cation/H+ antiporter subunit D family protein [Granulosicoccus sp.]
MSDQLPALQIMVTLLAAPLCVIIRHARGAWALAMAANTVAFVVAILLLLQVLDTGVIRYAVGGWAAPSGIEYYIDTMNAAVLVLVSGISALVLLYAFKSVEKSIPHAKHYLFYSAWMMCITGLLGIVITGDAFNVFVFLEISSLATYTLISFGSDRRALTASFNYLVLGSVGASFILIGIGFLYAATGTLNMVDLAQRIPDSESQRSVLVAFSFITIGVLIKSAVFPLHAWLPNAYTHAPVAVTAFLAGTATKVSLYVLLRFFFSIFGKDYSFGQLLLSGVLLPAAVAGFVLMSLVAMFQNDLRRMLAYSSVAQIGYIVAGFSLASQSGLTAGIVHIINHGIVKTSLFMAVGCILYRVGHAHTPSLDSLIRRMPFTSVAFIVSGLGLIGVPLTVGFVSKFTLIGAAMERGWWLVAGLVLISSLMAVVYIGRVIEVLLFRRARDSGPEPSGMREAPVSMLLPLYVLLAAGLYFGINGGATLEVAGQAAAQLLGGYQ